MTSDDLRVIGLDVPPTRALAERLAVDVIVAPDLVDLGADDTRLQRALEAWGTTLGAVPTCRNVVIATWESRSPVTTVASIGFAEWRARVELPLARWFETIRHATERCDDGGTVTVVVERPAPLDSFGRACEVAVGDGLVTLVRSFAHAVGPRGVRVNATITGCETAPDAALLGLPPILRRFPGRPELEVAGAVEFLCSSSAVGVSGTALRADCGRAWS
jgi:NAD(P)-dependent dehydrogenase (short-subunit alcohol dehydrogenase family)